MSFIPVRFGHVKLFKHGMISELGRKLALRFVFNKVTFALFTVITLDLHIEYVRLVISALLSLHMPVGLLMHAPSAYSIFKISRVPLYMGCRG